MNFESSLEQFSLRWNNFNDNMKIGFHDLLRTEDFVDVTLAVEGKLIQAHKMVLSVCSPYFKKIFKGNPCHHPVVFLKDVTHKELTDILQFMYLGEVRIQQEELGKFLKVAKTLQIKGLTDENTQSSSNESILQTSCQNDYNECINKTKLNNYDVLENETCSKKMKFSTIDNLDKSTLQKIQDQDELKNSQNEIPHIFPKTEPNEDDIESDQFSCEEDSINANESSVQLNDISSVIKDDVDQSNAGHLFSGKFFFYQTYPLT